MKKASNSDPLSIVVVIAYAFLVFSLVSTAVLLIVNNNGYQLFKIKASDFGSFYGGMLGPAFSFIGIVFIIQQYRKQVEDSNHNLQIINQDKKENDLRLKLEFNLKRLDSLNNNIIYFERDLRFEGWLKNRNGQQNNFKAEGREVFNTLAQFINSLDRITLIGNTLALRSPEFVSDYERECRYDMHVYLSYESVNFFDVYSFLTQLYTYRDFINLCYKEDNFVNEKIYLREYDNLLTKYLPSLNAVKNYTNYMIVNDYVKNDDEIKTLLQNIKVISSNLITVFVEDINLIQSRIS